MKLTPYQRIVRNAAKGKGVVLSYVECQQMSTDTTICDLADNDDEQDRLDRESAPQAKK